MSDVLIIQHDPFDGPGTVRDALAAGGFGTTVIHPYAGDPVPGTLGGAQGLVVLGGPMGLNERDWHPYLTDEMGLIRQAVSMGRPVLGLCLGAQLLAAALGASVRANPVKEIGWHPVYLTDEAGDDGLFRGITGPFQAFHWHGDTFDLPPGSVHLASSPLCQHQAFRYGVAAYGLQFHLEVDEAKVKEIVTVFDARLRDVGLEAQQVVHDAGSFLPNMQSVAGVVFGRWAGLLK